MEPHLPHYDITLSFAETELMVIYGNKIGKKISYLKA